MRSRHAFTAGLALVAAVACSPPAADLDADHAALMRLHDVQREAHLSRQATLLTGSFADTFYSISRGRVTTPSRQESDARFQSYFDAVTFVEWDDIEPPVVRISPDGRMAYLIVQKRVRLTTPDSAGRPVPEHTVFAWLETYEKQDGTWRLTALASTDRPGDPVPPAPDTMPVHQSFTISSGALAERRTINVYTPPGYDASSRAFPVLYMPDGGIGEDFPHVVTTIDSLVRRGRIRPVVVVGIENTQRRRDLTGPTIVASDSAIAPAVGASAAFRRFMRDELMPEVRSRYRTSDETAIVGESLAGLFVVETLLLEPDLFRRYIALSPSLWWNGGTLVDSAGPVLDALPGQRTLYLAAADEPGIADQAAELAAMLKAKAPPSLTWFYVPRPDLHHDTIFRAVAPGAFVKVLQ